LAIRSQISDSNLALLSEKLLGCSLNKALTKLPVKCALDQIVMQYTHRRFNIFRFYRRPYLIREFLPLVAQDLHAFRGTFNLLPQQGIKAPGINAGGNRPEPAATAHPAGFIEQTYQLAARKGAHQSPPFDLGPVAKTKD
jgi:hypothetical protein